MRGVEVESGVCASAAGGMAAITNAISVVLVTFIAVTPRLWVRGTIPFTDNDRLPGLLTALW
jgi:hypothetical protein